MVDERTLITHFNPKSPVSEAFRVLRTNIQFSSFDKPIKVIVVTSSGPGEGKSTVISNLAIAFAQSGSKTLLMDADLRKPKLHKIFDLDENIGLTNVLSRHDDYKKYIRKFNIDNLDILTCGVIPPNPAELLASNAMKKFVAELREDYDMIFIDAPPVCTVTDAAILSTIVDGTILVASSGSVEIDMLKKAKDLLDKVNANIIGVVLNRMDKSAQGNRYYYYYYYYYGDHSDGRKKKRKYRKRSYTGF